MSRICLGELHPSVSVRTSCKRIEGSQRNALTAWRTLGAATAISANGGCYASTECRLDMASLLHRDMYPKHTIA